MVLHERLLQSVLVVALFVFENLDWLGSLNDDNWSEGRDGGLSLDNRNLGFFVKGNWSLGDLGLSLLVQLDLSEVLLLGLDEDELSNDSTDEQKHDWASSLRLGPAAFLLVLLLVLFFGSLNRRTMVLLGSMVLHLLSVRPKLTGKHLVSILARNAGWLLGLLVLRLSGLHLDVLLDSHMVHLLPVLLHHLSDLWRHVHHGVMSQSIEHVAHLNLNVHRHVKLDSLHVVRTLEASQLSVATSGCLAIWHEELLDVTTKFLGGNIREKEEDEGSESVPEELPDHLDVLGEARDLSGLGTHHGNEAHAENDKSGANERLVDNDLLRSILHLGVLSSLHLLVVGFPGSLTGDSDVVGPVFGLVEGVGEVEGKHDAEGSEEEGHALESSGVLGHLGLHELEFLDKGHLVPRNI